MTRGVRIGGVVVLFDIPEDLLGNEDVFDLLDSQSIPDGFSLFQVEGPFINGTMAATFKVDSDDFDRDAITKYVYRRIFQRKRRKNQWWQKR